MPYSNIEDLKNKIDRKVLTQLTDDERTGTGVEATLLEALNHGYRYVSSAVPDFLTVDNAFAKDIEQLKAYEYLLRRKGYFNEANDLSKVVKEMIQSGILKQNANSQPVLNKKTAYHCEEAIVSRTEWDKSLRFGE
jgi:hypothetical protein